MKIVRDAVKLGFLEMVDSACRKVSEKGLAKNVSEKDKDAVNGLMCESLLFVADVVIERKAGAVEVGTHLAKNNINLAKLSQSQQAYCHALKAELALNSAELAVTAVATYTGAVAGAKVGAVTGGLAAGVATGGAAVVPGAVAGGLIGAGGPLALGGYQMYKSAAEITELAIQHHQQCGPLAMRQATSPRAAAPASPAAGAAH